MYVGVVSHWDGQTIPGIHRYSSSGYIYMGSIPVVSKEYPGMGKVYATEYV